VGLRDWLAKSLGSVSLRSWIGRWAASGEPAGLAPNLATLRPPEEIEDDVPRRDRVTGDLWATDTPTSFLTDTQPLLTPNEQIAVGGDWVQMASSNVDEIRYLAADAILEVIFLNGYHYQYYRVPPQVFLDFLQTDSPGRFVWNVLRADGYEYARLGAGAFPVYRTGNVRPTANVVRRLLPEEQRAHQQALERMRPGEAAFLPRTKLEQMRYPKQAPQRRPR
jgi:hypothetical protein